MVSSRRRIILVIGMHRSGTSLMAHILSDAGISFGSDLLDESVPDNVEGYGEHAALVGIHEKLLEDLDRTWHGPKGSALLPKYWQIQQKAINSKKLIREIIDNEFKSERVWAVKDPRLCRLLPLWLDILGELGLEICIVICFRNPQSVAKSLKKRNDMPFDLALEIWQRHYEDIFTALSGSNNPSKQNIRKVFVTEYDDLVNFPQTQIDDLLAHIGEPIVPERRARAIARVKSRLRHHRQRSITADVKTLKILYTLRTKPFVYGCDSGVWRSPINIKLVTSIILLRAYFMVVLRKLSGLRNVTDA